MHSHHRAEHFFADYFGTEVLVGRALRRREDACALGRCSARTRVESPAFRASSIHALISVAALASSMTDDKTAAGSSESFTSKLLGAADELSDEVVVDRVVHDEALPFDDTCPAYANAEFKVRSSAHSSSASSWTIMAALPPSSRKHALFACDRY